MTISEVMQAMPQEHIPEKAAGVNAAMQLDFTADRRLYAMKAFITGQVTVKGNLSLLIQ